MKCSAGSGGGGGGGVNVGAGVGEAVGVAAWSESTVLTGAAVAVAGATGVGVDGAMTVGDVVLMATWVAVAVGGVGGAASGVAKSPGVNVAGGDAWSPTCGPAPHADRTARAMIRPASACNRRFKVAPQRLLRIRRGFARSGLPLQPTARLHSPATSAPPAMLPQVPGHRCLRR